MRVKRASLESEGFYAILNGMKHNKSLFPSLLAVFTLLASCVSSSDTVDTSADVLLVVTPSPKSLTFVRAQGFIIGKAGNSSAERMAAEMATNLVLPYSWWNGFDRLGEKVNIKADFTIRNSSTVAEDAYLAAEGIALFIRKTEMEVSEVEGFSDSPGLMSQSLPLSGITDPSSVLLKSRMEAIKAQSLQKGYVRLQEAKVEGESLILVWDIRG